MTYTVFKVLGVQCYDSCVLRVYKLSGTLPLQVSVFKGELYSRFVLFNTKVKYYVTSSSHERDDL